MACADSVKMPAFQGLQARLQRISEEIDLLHSVAELHV
jgi:hypothetical protein